MKHPASTSASARIHGDGAAMSTASAAAVATSRASTRRAGREDAPERAATRPPSRLPTAHAPSSGPARPREPSSSANAVTASSIAPNEAPMKVTPTRSTTRAGLASAPAIDRSPAVGAGRQRRDDGVVANATVPPTSSRAHPTRPTPGEVATARAPARTTGPTTNVTSSALASRANAACRASSSGTRVDHSALMHPLSGGWSRPDRAASAARAAMGVASGTSAIATRGSDAATAQRTSTRLWPRRSTSRPTNGEPTASAREKEATTSPPSA